MDLRSLRKGFAAGHGVLADAVSNFDGFFSSDRLTVISACMDESVKQPLMVRITVAE